MSVSCPAIFMPSANAITFHFNNKQKCNFGHLNGNQVQHVITNNVLNSIEKMTTWTAMSKFKPGQTMTTPS